MAGTAVSDGYEPTTIEQFISDWPPATNDIVHVEDGGWVNPAGDFGSPSFINWNWPPSYTDSNGNNLSLIHILPATALKLIFQSQTSPRASPEGSKLKPEPSV